MLSRLISRTFPRIHTFPIAVTPKLQLNPNHTTPQFLLLRPFSSNSNSDDGNNGDASVPPSNPWKIFSDTETSSSFDRIFADGGGTGTLSGVQGSGVDSVGGREKEDSWLKGNEEADDDAFKGIETAEAGGSMDGDGWLTAEGYKTWTLGTEEEGKDVFNIGESGGGGSEIVELENEEARLKQGEKEEEQRRRLESEEKQLTAVLKGSL